MESEQLNYQQLALALTRNAPNNCNHFGLYKVEVLKNLLLFKICSMLIFITFSLSFSLG